MQTQHLGIIGYGEVGKIFALALSKKTGVQSFTAWDLKFAATSNATSNTPHEQAHAKQHGIEACANMAQLCERSQLIFSAVTAANTLAVAQEAALHLRPGSVFVDLNSASPGTKQQAANAVQAKGAHYVEAAVMSSVPPYGVAVPILLGGAQAAALMGHLNQWGMNTKAVSTEIGIASAIKMCRSVMIKGLEALVIESYATARAYGVADHVLPTLAETFPSIDWAAQGAYFFSRVAQHGQRRAEEMREAALTVREAGFEPIMASAIAAKHQWVADQARQGAFVGIAKNAPWQEWADCLLQTGEAPRL